MKKPSEEDAHSNPVIILGDKERDECFRKGEEEMWEEFIWLSLQTKY